MAVQTFLDFEKPIAELEARVAELRETAHAGELDLDAEIGRLEAKSGKLLRDTYSKLTPWQKAQVARHPERPHFKDYVAGLTGDFLPLAGDRAFADDPAILGGLAMIDGRKVLLIGHEKGDDTASRLRHNFGSGGAVAIAAANRVLMFEHAVYSVISPEGCASILWRTADKAADAAEAMKITAQDLQSLGVVDRIVPEPLGGAHRDPEGAIGTLKEAIAEELSGCGALGGDELLRQRRAKYLAIA